MSGDTVGAVRLILRLEGLLIFAAGSAVYFRLGFGRGAFALFFLAPDLSFLGYLAGPRVGAVAYNAVHSYAGPIILLLVGYVLAHPSVSCAGLIWAAHIGLDRALGYGLKYSAGFRFTHLGSIGRAGNAAPGSQHSPTS